MVRGANRRSPSGLPAGRQAGWATASVLACAALALAAGGCGASKFTHCKTTAADFRQQVINLPDAVLVEFYKSGCATCWLLEPTLDQLAKEYGGRMKFVSFEMMTPYFAITCREVQKQHRIAYYPTVILFVNGEEKNRWILDYSIDHYREVLSEVVGVPAPKDTGDKTAGSPSAGDGECPGRHARTEGGASPVTIERLGAEPDILGER
jgi:thioredoxin 1